jgi:hypothetical protein
MAQNVQKIKNAGVTMIWSPAPWKDSTPNGMGYLWHSFDLNSTHGSEADMNNMINTMNANGVKVIVDIVANHSDSGHSNPAYPWDSQAWEKNNYEEWGYYKFENHDLNTAYVYHDIKNAMNHIKAKGVTGWRYDMVHGFPSGRVLGWNQDTGASFAVGEYDWGMHAKEGWAEQWAANAQSTVFDFWTKGSINSGNPSTFGGLATNERPEARARAVTFVENHDTMRYGMAAPDDSMGARSKAYAWILLTPGTPTIHWHDLMDGWVGYDFLKELIWTRRNAGIKAHSGFHYNETNGGSGRAVIIDGDNYDVALALDWPDWSPSGDWTHVGAASGWNGYLNVWTGNGSGGGNGGGNGGGSSENWYFSSNINGWSTWDMVDIGSGIVEIQHWFHQGDEFRIRNTATDWSGEAYPPGANWRIWQGDGHYTVQLNVMNKDINVWKH